jgi:hypothetical protein
MKNNQIETDDQFKYNFDNEANQIVDDYAKELERDLESNCDCANYINKLQVKEIPDEELLTMDKKEIINLKNYQIEQLKAYIDSLEREKQDLIENFKDTTNILIDRIKDLEFNDRGFRPDTPMITKDLKNKGKVKINGIKGNNWGNQKEINSNISSVSTNKEIVANIITQIEEKKERCPNCQKEFNEDEFMAHSLDCLRNKIRCKKCGEMINEKLKKEHILEWRSTKKIYEAIDKHDGQVLQKCIDHGYSPTKIIDESNGNSIINLYYTYSNSSYYCKVRRYQIIGANCQMSYQYGHY